MSALARAIRSHHRPYRLRCLLCVGREARQSRNPRQTGHCRWTRARCCGRGLLHRAAVRHPLAAANLAGAETCPDVVVRPRMDHYVSVSREIRKRMLALTPLVQPLSIDEAFLDLGGTERCMAARPPRRLSAFRTRYARRSALRCRLVTAARHWPRWPRTATSPTGFAIDSDTAAAWLAPQPVSVLFGLGKSAVARLNAAGITLRRPCVRAGTAGDRRACTTRHLIRDLAAGVDPRPVTPDRGRRASPARPPSSPTLAPAPSWKRSWRCCA